MNFTPKGYHTEDDYMTPKSAWKSIEKYLPKEKEYTLHRLKIEITANNRKNKFY